jgi:DNA adenine methylase
MTETGELTAWPCRVSELAVPPCLPLSPLRYPGGKARLARFLATIIKANDLRGCSYYEPYAGGAGAALNLLAAGVVSEIHLNDADRRLFCFWRAILDESSRFADKILTTPVTIDEWKRQRGICAHPRGHARFDVGFAAFYVNRCSRSGVLDGAGPIGGYKQEGTWKVDVRFVRESLAARVRNIGALRDSIHVSNQDALRFLKSKLPKGGYRESVFVYLDPPYVTNGRRLYWNFYQRRDHSILAQYLKGQTRLHWLLSYDQNKSVRLLYPSCRILSLPIHYSLQVKREARELIITPRYLGIPRKPRAPSQLLSCRRAK